MSIEARNLVRYYGRQAALHGVDVLASQGEIVGLLGPNGAGKTTLMKIITGYIPPHQGSVSVCGIDVLANPLKARSKIGYLPEHNPLYHDMYVREYLQFVSGLHFPGINNNDRISEIISLTGLEPEKRKKIRALSKGYRQRVGIAQALIHDPEVLILDEPTSGLDPNQLIEIRQLIRESGKKKTVILSTHIMQEAEAVCDRIILLHKGMVKADASVEQLRRQAKAGSSVFVVFDSPVRTEDLLALPGVAECASDGGNGYHIILNPGADPRQDLFYLAVKLGVVILELRPATYSLQQVFQELTS